MTKALTLQDYQLISSYLDSTCSARESAQVEARQKADMQFKQAVLEFQHTRRLLRALPQKRAPRNFTLSPSQVPARPQRFFLAPALNFVSLAATVLLVVIFAGSQLAPDLLGAKATQSAAPMLMAASSVSENAQATGSAVSVPMITWGQTGAYDMGGVDTKSARSGLGGGLGGGASTASDTMTQSKNPPAETSTAEPLPGLMAEAPTTAATLDPSTLVLGLPAAAEQGKEIAPAAFVEPEKAPLPRISLVEIILAGLAALSALTAFILRRRR